jgi:hypothetical protein
MVEADFEKMRSHPLWKEVMTKMADQALLGFAHTIYAIADSKTVQLWQNDERLSKIGYKVDMGFGLHTGWAIEGAIGSTHKIDASYLSPNVNISARLKAATEQYGVWLLISGPLYDMLQPRIKNCCRHLDRVTLKGSKIPLDIYTLDMKPKSGNHKINSPLTSWERGDGSQLPGFQLAAAARASSNPSPPPTIAKHKDDPEADLLSNTSSRDRGMLMREAIARASLKARALSRFSAAGRMKVDPLHGEKEKEPTLQEILGDTAPELSKESRAKAIKALQAGVSAKFISTYNLGTKAYLQGDWPSAVELFNKARALELGITDKPRQLIMDVMREHNFIAPTQWKGYRALDKK